MQPQLPSPLKPLRADIPGITPELASMYFDAAEVSPAEVEALGLQIGGAMRALRGWSALAFDRPFDAILDEWQLIPVAYPLLERPRIVLPVHLVNPALGDDLRPDIVHELAHMLLFARGSPFLSEGWAVACSYQLSASNYFPFSVREDAPSLHQLLAEQSECPRALAEDLRPHGTWGELQCQGTASERTRLAYGRAGSFALYLIEERGVLPFVQLLQALRDEPSLAEELAVERVYGTALATLESGWREKLDRVRPPSDAGGRVPAGERMDLLLSPEAADWALRTDAEPPSGSTATFVLAPDEVRVSGKMATGLPFPCVLLERWLRRDHAPVDVSGYRGVRFEAYGDGKVYHLSLVTPSARSHGSEFIHLLETRPEWTRHEVPFSRFHRFVADRRGWTGTDTLALRLRAFGYRGQDIRIHLRNLELYP